MKFSWNWLKDYVELDGISPQDVANRLTMTVAELEGVEHIGAGLSDVLVGSLTKIAAHPDSETLQVVTVDVGGRLVSGVSGAPNLKVGMKVPVALPGATLPGDFNVQVSTIRGVESALVLLSERELGLSDDHSGVLELPADVALGAKLVDVLPVEDWVFEVDNKSITHRPDLWGHLGLAREIGSMVKRPLRPLDSPLPQSDVDSLSVSVDNFADCPRYTATAFGSITVAPSPFWIRHRLRAVGLRPISNIVDLSNFVMLALGEPTHTFDRRFVGDDTIRVRRATEAEPFKTLDETELVLSPEDLLIADSKGGIALAGVMGGENSEIRDDTTDVILECATFNPGLVRRTALRHGIRTDSSTRFEKSLDPNLPELAIRLFWQLLKQVSPEAKVTSKIYDLAGFDKTPLKISLDPEFITRRLGLAVPAEQTKAILENLGFGIAVDAKGIFEVTVPSWRATKDVSTIEDLLEEIGRVIGYDKVPPTPPLAGVDLVPVRPLRSKIRAIKRILTGDCGLDEVMTYSFDSTAMLTKLGYSQPDPVVVANPISSDFKTLRDHLSPNLLGAIERNAQSIHDFGLFEIGRVFAGTHVEDGTPWQRYRLAIGIYRRAAKPGTDAENLLRQLRGYVEHLCGRLDLADLAVLADVEGERLPWMSPKATLEVTASGRRIGWLTRVHPATMRALDIPGVAVIAELDVESINDAPVAARLFTPVPRFPAISMDISLVADEEVRAGDLFRAIRSRGGPHLFHVELFDTYRGSPIPEGKRSLSFRMVFKSLDRTLEDAEVKEAVQSIIDEAAKVGAGLWGHN